MIKKNPTEKKSAKLSLSTETIRRLDALSTEELAQVAGGGTTGYSPCRNYATIYCSVGGGRGTCTL
jgi:hypothetical protein